MAVLLTGGTGFVGRNLKDALSSIFPLLTPNHTDLDLVNQEAVNLYFEEHDIDAVVHAAIKPMHRNAKDTSDILRSNLLIYFNLASAVEKHGIKMLHIGSGGCYDNTHYIPFMKEDYFAAYIPQSTEYLVKYVTSLNILSSKCIFDLRVFGVFGKYEDYSIRFISNAICKALFNMPITLRQNRRFSYLYIDDLSKIVTLMLEKELKYHAYNIVPDETFTLLELAEIICEEMEMSLPVQVLNKDMGLDYTGDNARFRSEFPQFEFSGIRSSVRKLIMWYRKNKITIEKNCLYTLLNEEGMRKYNITPPPPPIIEIVIYAVIPSRRQHR